MDLKSVNADPGLTQAESVKELVRLREFESITVTLLPSKYNALPAIPLVHAGPFANVPVLPFPEESAAVVPVPSSNFQ